MLGQGLVLLNSGRFLLVDEGAQPGINAVCEFVNIEISFLKRCA